MAKTQIPELVAAAQKIEKEQTRLEELAHALHKTKLQSEKHITRAARELQDALAQQEVLAQSLHALGEAMAHMQVRQQDAVNVLGARAQEIQARRERLTEHMMRYAALASKVGELLQSMSSALGSTEQIAALNEAEAQLAIVIEESTALGRDARADDFNELAQEADTLKQNFQQIRAQLAARTAN